MALATPDLTRSEILYEITGPKGARGDGSVCNGTDDEIDLETFITAEDDDISSDLSHTQDNDGSDMEDVHANPTAAGKRKASPECIEGAGPLKKARTETGGQENIDLSTTDTTTKPQQSLDPAQKQYLVEKLTNLQKLKYAASFMSSQRPVTTKNYATPKDLNTVLEKLLEDKYTSGQALQADVQYVVQNVFPKRGSRRAKTAAGKQVLARVTKFVDKLPRSPKKADENTGNDSAALAPRQLNPGQSQEQERETRYARKQVDAFRNGTQSNKGKNPVNLVLEKLVDLAEEERKELDKLAARKRKHETSTRSMIDGRQSGEKRDGKVEAEGAKDDNETSECEVTNEIAEDDNMGTSEDQVIEADAVEETTEEHEDEEYKDDSTSKEVNEALDETADTVNKKDQGDHGKLIDRKAIGNIDKTKLNSTSMRLTNIKSYEADLAKLSKDPPTQQQIAELDRSATTGPNFMGRTASTTRGANFGDYHNKTNGYTAHDILLPAADSRKKSNCSHQHLADLTQGELKYMTGNHLIWKDLKADEFLSYSQDPLFLVVHGLRRHHEGQGNVTIQFLDRRQAKTPDGRAANFYNALDIYTAFEVPIWSGWGSTDNIKLHPRKFTHEYLTHGPVLTSDTVFKQAHMKDLIADGLYKIFPDFEAPEDHKRSGLYTLQVVHRKIGYPPASHGDVASREHPHVDSASAGTPISVASEGALPSGSSRPPSSPPAAKALAVTTSETLIIVPRRKIGTSDSHKPKRKTKKAGTPIYSYQNCLRQIAMTVELLDTVRKVTLNFRNVPQGVDASTIEPPLHAFICFLTFEKRRKADPIFIDWVKKRYKGTAFSP